MSELASLAPVIIVLFISVIDQGTETVKFYVVYCFKGLLWFSVVLKVFIDFLLS